MTAVKVTLTLPDDLLASVDRYVTAHPGATRSGVCAGALAGWLRDQQEAEIARYYETMSEQERAEDSEWAALASRSAAAHWP
jgi:hypothetical protein